MTDYAHMNLTDVVDSAPEGGMGEIQEARFAQRELGAERTGFSLQRIKPGMRQGFGHRHEEAEEVYVVLSGAGRVKLDDEIRELAPLDAVRVSPEVTRAFEAGPDSHLELLVFGASHPKDGEILAGWWAD